MKKAKKWFNHFQRVTSTGNYIAEIDGLRFLAILSVMFFHIRGAFSGYFNKHHVYNDDLSKHTLNIFLTNGRQGVEIFFAISGFILALPFIKQYRYNSKKVQLKSFYLRRVSRLEPPYLIALIILFIGVLINGEYSFSQLFPSLLASMVYMHGIIFHELPKVTTVAWSLEVEVQFYLLMPLLMRIFSFSKHSTRYILLLTMLLLPVVQNLLPVEVNNLYKFFQYFAAGILFADFYLDKSSFIWKLDKKIFIVVGLLLLVSLFGVDGYISATVSSKVPWPVFINKVIYPFIIFGFFVIVAGNPTWKKIMSFRLITIIGGMCYSIYLFHTAIITLFQKYVFGLHLSHNIVIDYFISALILSVIIVIISSVFYILVERPCMEKDWYKKFAFKKNKATIKKENIVSAEG